MKKFLLKISLFWNEEYSSENATMQNIILLIMFIAFAIIAFFNMNNGVMKNDLYSYNYVNAIENGQVFLQEEPSEKLLGLKNPYDPIERLSIKRDKDYIWDAALYNNHYYVYFGILPVLILLIPCHLLTGIFMKSATAVLIFSLICIFLLTILVELFFKKYFKKLPFKMLVYSEIIVLFGTTVIWINVAPRFYELVSIASLDFVLFGIYILLSMKDISIPKLLIGCLSMALAVACRPTSLIASAILVPVFLNQFIHFKSNKKEFLKLIIPIVIPYALVGISLMYFNYIRFGSIFEFGTRYQLTVNDMRNFKCGLLPTCAGFLCNLFNVPVFIAKFPFIQTNSNILETNFLNYYIEDMPGGVFFLAPIAFVIFSAKKVIKNTDNKELKRLIITLLLTGITLNIIVANKAGCTGRYLLDFSWCFVISGVLIFLEQYNLLKEKESKIILEKIFTIITIYTLLVNIFTGFLDVGGLGMKTVSPEIYQKCESLICFWK